MVLKQGKALACLLLCLLLCLTQTAFAVPGETGAQDQTAPAAAVPRCVQQSATEEGGEDVPYANSDVCADTLTCYFELDPDSGCALRRDAETLIAVAITDRPVSQMALLDDTLYLLCENGIALLRYSIPDGTVERLRGFDAAVLRFAVSEEREGLRLYYLTDGCIRSCSLSGEEETTVCAEDGLYRFWLVDGGLLEYMTDPDTIHTLDPQSGAVTERANVRSSLSGNVRGRSSIDRLKEKFPEGKYWNHVGGSNNPDGWTESPCTHHGHCGYKPDECECNSFDDCIQCFGFGYKLAYDYYGSLPDDWERIWWRPTDGIKAGDVFRYRNNRHTIWITAVDGDTVTFADCNWDCVCGIRWDQTISISTLRSSATFRDIAPATADCGDWLAAPIVTADRSECYDDCFAVFSWEEICNATEYRLELYRNNQLCASLRQAECSYVLDCPQEGAYRLDVFACDEQGQSTAGSCALNVTHCERDTAFRLWFSPDADEQASEKLLIGDGYWASYALYDRTTGESYSTYCRTDYQVQLWVRSPSGERVAALQSDGPLGSIWLPVTEEGDYTLYASLMGAQSLEAALTLTCRVPGCADLGHIWQPEGSYDSDTGRLTLRCMRCHGERALLLPQEACTEGESCPGASYTDMPSADTWAHEGLEFLLQNGIMNGVSQTSLAPGLPMNRAMLVTLLWRLEGEPGSHRLRYFEDVGPNTYYTAAVAWAAENGVVNGVSETRFAPTQQISREQLATILYRYASRFGAQAPQTDALNDFPDGVSASGFAVEALCWATERGLINGVGTQGQTLLAPQASATRAQVAAILLRFVRSQFFPTDDPAQRVSPTAS